MNPTSSKQKILVIGSINLDHCLNVPRFPRAGETLVGNHYQTVAGGKGANQAVACARLNADITLIANVGADTVGYEMIDCLSHEGIDTGAIHRTANAMTGTAFIFVDASGENMMGLAQGANLTLSTEQIIANQSRIEAADYLLIQLEVPLDSLSHAVNIAKRSDTLTILNPAPAAALDDKFLRQIDIITPNQIEAEALTGIKVEDERSARSAVANLHQLGIATVIITMGHQGAYCSNQGDGILIPAIKVTAKDTTAAGDAFNGAFVVGLSRGLSHRQAVAFAHQCSAISVTRSGAQPSIPHLHEVEHLLPDAN